VYDGVYKIVDCWFDVGSLVLEFTSSNFGGLRDMLR